MCPRGSCPGTAFSGPMSRFRWFSVCVSCPRCWSSFCCNFPGFRGLAEVVLEASCCLKPARGFPPGWHEEKAGMCFQTRIFDPCFWRGEADQVETQMDPADPISLWWQRIGKVRAVRQWGVKPSDLNGPRKWWFWNSYFCWFGCIPLITHCSKKLRGAQHQDGMGKIQQDLEWCPLVLLIFF